MVTTDSLIKLTEQLHSEPILPPVREAFGFVKESVGLIETISIDIPSSFATTWQTWKHKPDLIILICFNYFILKQNLGINSLSHLYPTMRYCNWSVPPIHGDKNVESWSIVVVAVVYRNQGESFLLPSIILK